MRVFFDSSSFAKRFVAEPGTDQVTELLEHAAVVGLSVICLPEVVSAIRRRRMDRQMTPTQYEETKRRIQGIQHADIVDLGASVIQSAIEVLESSRVRSLDALHVACAIAWEADLFVSSDHRQIVAAKKAGLVTRQV